MPSDELAPGTLNIILKQAVLKSWVLMRYAIVIEKAEHNYSTCVPDVPGCVATGATTEEAESQIREAITIHVERLREEGAEIPRPASRIAYVEIAASLVAAHGPRASVASPIDSRPIGCMIVSKR